MNKKLYHYTEKDKLEKIKAKGKIRASELSSFFQGNKADECEFIHGINLICSILEKKHSFKRLYPEELIKKTFNSPAGLWMILCLCEIKSNRYLWKNYGKENNEILCVPYNLYSDDLNTLFKIKYCDTEDECEDKCADFFEEMSKYRDLEKYTEEWIEKIIRPVIKQALSLKRKKFIKEQETRYILFVDASNENKFIEVSLESLCTESYTGVK